MLFHPDLLVLQLLHLESLPLARGLSCGTIPKDSLYTALFLLIFRLGAFPATCQTKPRPRASFISFLTYLGGKLVLGIGSSWPHDFLFLTGFFSSGLLSSDLACGASREVAEGEMVSGSTSDAGVLGKEDMENVSSIVVKL